MGFLRACQAHCDIGAVFRIKLINFNEINQLTIVKNIQDVMLKKGVLT